MGKIKWTEGTLRKEASKYKYKVDFKKGSGGAYATCIRRFPHILGDMFKNKNISWDESNLREEASKYNTKAEFQRGSPSAYGACASRFKHLLVDIFEDVYSSWDEKSLREEASRYDTKNEFRKGSYGAYQACNRRFKHLLVDLFEDVYNSWDESNLREEASKYGTKTEFLIGSHSAYQACHRGYKYIIYELFENQSNASSYDVGYLWRSSYGWWKFGVTSLRLGDQRIQAVSSKADTNVEELFMWHMDNALAYEKSMKDLGERLPPSDKFDGYTECRYLFDYEIEQAIRQGDSLGERIEVQ